VFDELALFVLVRRGGTWRLAAGLHARPARRVPLTTATRSPCIRRAGRPRDRRRPWGQRVPRVPSSRPRTAHDGGPGCHNDAGAVTPTATAAAPLQVPTSASAARSTLERCRSCSRRDGGAGDPTRRPLPPHSFRISSISSATSRSSSGGSGPYAGPKLRRRPGLERTGPTRRRNGCTSADQSARIGRQPCSPHGSLCRGRWPWVPRGLDQWTAAGQSRNVARTVGNRRVAPVPIRMTSRCLRLLHEPVHQGAEFDAGPQRAPGGDS
jgi:hypothetical protein